MSKLQKGVGDIWKKFAKLSKKSKILIVVSIVFLLFIFKLVSSNKQEEDIRVVAVENVVTEVLSESEKQQINLEAQYGVAPDGFRWNSDGSLISLGDDTKTPEDVGYSYIRALSQLEFVTAAKYSSSAIVGSNYNAMYNTQTVNGINQFTRNLYKEVLISIEINGVDSIAIFEDGRYILTFSLTLIDLTNKDFWLEDMPTIYETLYSYSTTEGDTSKANQYLYDYLLSYYSSDVALKRTVNVDLVLDVVSNGGWLVSKDLDLDSLCRYQNGAVVSDYIWSSYTKWINENK